MGTETSMGTDGGPLYGRAWFPHTSTNARNVASFRVCSWVLIISPVALALAQAERASHQMGQVGRSDSPASSHLLRRIRRVVPRETRPTEYSHDLHMHRLGAQRTSLALAARRGTRRQSRIRRRRRSPNNSPA